MIKKYTQPALCPLCESTPMSVNQPSLKSVKSTLLHLEHIRYKKQEYFVCLSLDSRQHLIAHRIVTIGLIDVVLAHPREIFADPLADRASSIVIAHNHPSGNAQPSEQDIQVTKQLVAAGEILGIPLRDHLIVTTDGHFSFQQNHLLHAA